MRWQCMACGYTSENVDKREATRDALMHTETVHPPEIDTPRGWTSFTNTRSSWDDYDPGDMNV